MFKLHQPTEIELNPEFSRALALLNEGQQNLFITGRAGTGKSTLLKHFVAEADVRPVVIAPTGLAALYVGGQTVHRFFGFGINVTSEKIAARHFKPRNPNLYKNLKTIIIDEVSMLRADLLDCIDTFLRLYGPHKGQPFGGVVMIFVGDLYQLPPVVNRDEQDHFRNHYSSEYFFSASAYESLNMEVIELKTIYRQHERDFIELLERVRLNNLRKEDFQALNRRCIPSQDLSYVKELIEEDYYIYLTTTNKVADKVNAQHLATLSSKQYTSEADISGDFTKEYYPTLPLLQFKVGAQIMLLNNDSDGQWVNGSMARIEEISIQGSNTDHIIATLLDSHEQVTVELHTWEVFNFKAEGQQILTEKIGTFEQYPFRLAWALTIHKSQGQTFSRVLVDLQWRTFAPGQVYVALSRCSTFEGLLLKQPITSRHLISNRVVTDFFAGHRIRPAGGTPAQRQVEMTWQQKP